MSKKKRNANNQQTAKKQTPKTSPFSGLTTKEYFDTLRALDRDFETIFGE